MTKAKRYKRYSSEFKREALLRASEEGSARMVTNTPNSGRRNSTGVIRLVLAAVGAVAVGSLFPPDPASAQASNSRGTAPIIDESTDDGWILAVEHAQREKAPAGSLIGKRMAIQLVQKPSSPGAWKYFKDCDICPEMVVVPAGSFVMGSPESEQGHTRDESPQHRVKISRPFAVGRYEVTIAEWHACVADSACPGDRGVHPGNERQPATGMSWNSAKAYVAWLSRKTGKRYRLLSEAEWEYAARAGTTTPYHTGVSINASQARVADKKSNAGSGRSSGFAMKVKIRSSAPVGRFPPNVFGLNDVHGNVWEWVEDCVNDGYVGAPTDGSAWTTGKCHRRVMRGGSWVDFPEGVRSAVRSGIGADKGGRTLGLRVAKTLD